MRDLTPGMKTLVEELRQPGALLFKTTVKVNGETVHQSHPSTVEWLKVRGMLRATGYSEGHPPRTYRLKENKNI